MSELSSVWLKALGLRRTCSCCFLAWRFLAPSAIFSTGLLFLPHGCTLLLPPSPCQTLDFGFILSSCLFSGDIRAGPGGTGLCPEQGARVQKLRSVWVPTQRTIVIHGTQSHTAGSGDEGGSSFPPLSGFQPPRQSLCYRNFHTPFL